MTTLKYEILENDSILVGSNRLYRIRALRDVSYHAGKGELGGYVSSLETLSQTGESWVCYGAMAFGGAKVRDNAVLEHKSRAAGGAIIKDNASLKNDAQAIGKVVVANNERLAMSAVLLNAAVTQCSQFTREGNTTFTFRYRAGPAEGTIAIPVGFCDSVMALELSLYRDNQPMVAYVSSSQAELYRLSPDEQYLELSKIVNGLK